MIFLVFYCHLTPLTAQQKRSFQYNGQTVDVLAYTNRVQQLPFAGMKAFIVLDQPHIPLDSIFAKDAIHRIAINGMADYAYFYYLNGPYPIKDPASFLRTLIDRVYADDYIDRNQIQLVVGQLDSGSFQALEPLNDIVAGISIIGMDSSQNYSRYSVTSIQEVWDKSSRQRTAVRYPVPGIIEMEEAETLKEQHLRVKGYGDKRKTVYLSFTAGSHHISNSYKEEFDTTTLVDFTKFKTLWNFRSGYVITKWLSIGADVAFIYSGKQKKIDSLDWGNGNGISLQGSGYAGAMIRYGLNLSLILYAKNRWSTFAGMDIGNINAFAGGGHVSKTAGSAKTTSIVKSKQQTTYFNILAGANYQLGDLVYISGNMQYHTSEFKKKIGSVSGFTGLSVNLGFGISIPTNINSR